MADRILIYAAALVALAAICTTVIGQTPESYKAQWIFVANAVEHSEPIPTPEPDNPDSDECENCGGTGKLGDGTVERVCPVCDGTGKRTDTKPVVDNGWPPKDLTVTKTPKPATPQLHGVIDYYGADWCPACKYWERNYKASQTKGGWKIRQFHPSSGQAVPYFYVWVNGSRSKKHVGVLTNRDLRTLHASAKRATGPTPPSYTFAGARGEGVYQPRWTWPGDLRSHLSSAPHSIDASSMTQDEMERWHDQHHAQIGAH